VQPAPRDVAALFDPHRVAMVFEVRECAFDAARLRERLARDLAAAGVVVVLGTEAEVVRPDGKGGSTGVVVALRKDADGWEVRTPLVINATYSRLNHLLERSGGARIALKHELTEMALVAPPPALGGAAVTVMDGPFFSLMPYPSRGLYTLSHVRYTPHCSWLEGEAPARDGDAMLQARPASRAVHMLRDAERYLPCMRDARYVESIWEVKTILPRSEVDDSRPILFRQDPHLPAVYSVLGAKIDSVYDVEAAMAATFGFAAAAGR